MTVTSREREKERERWFVLNYREATHTRGVTSFRGERWFALKRPQCDTNGVGEYEVTVSFERHAQAERAKKQKREEKAISWGATASPRAWKEREVFL